MTPEAALIEQSFQIVDKSGIVVPFRLNETQAHYDDRRTQRDIIVKARQQGFSSFVSALIVLECISTRNVRAVLVAHDSESTEKIFDRARFFVTHLRFDKTKMAVDLARSNRREFYFKETNSTFYIGTAGSDSFGRGDTINFLHCCLDEDSLIIDQNGGLVKIKDIFPHFTYVRTHTGKIAPVTFVSEQEKDCLSFSLRGLKPFPLVMTPEHKVLSSKGWTTAESLKVGDFICFPVFPVAKESCVLEIPSGQKARPQGGGTACYCPPRIETSYTFGRLVGLYLAEGHINLTETRVVFTVHQDEVPTVLSWLRPLDIYVGWPAVRERPGSKAVDIEINNVAFVRFLSSLVGRTDTKRLPLSWWQLGENFVRGMVHGYLFGDGHSDTTSRMIRATSVLSTLTVGFRDALASLGYGWASIQHKAAAVRAGRNEKEAFTLVLCGSGVDQLCEELNWKTPVRSRSSGVGTPIYGGYAWLEIINTTSVGARRVYDLEVGDEDHSYCTLQGAVSNSEVAMWPHPQAITAGLFQAVPREGSIWMESTANGRGNWFHLQSLKAQNSQSRFKSHFYPWWFFPEYSLPAHEVPRDFTLTEDEQQLKDSFNLTTAQLAWRREKAAELDSSDLLGGANLFPQEYPSTFDEAFIASGQSVFRVIPTHTKEPVQQERFLTIYHNPEEGHSYVLGVDVAAGVGRDRSVIWGLDCERFEQAFEWASDCVDPDELGAFIADLGRRYNMAWVAPELNNHGLATIDSLRHRYNAGRILQRYQFDHRDGVARTDRLGWMTTEKSKSQMITNLRQAITLGGLKVFSERTRNELSTFVEKDSGRIEAQDGCYDDRVIACALAVTGYKHLYQPRTFVEPVRPPQFSFQLQRKLALAQFASNHDGLLPAEFYQRADAGVF